MRKIKSYFLFCIGLFCFTQVVLSCKNDSQSSIKDSPSYLEQHAEALQKEIDLSGIPKASLSKKAQKVTANWSEFVSVKSEVDNLKRTSLQGLISNADNLITAIEKLADSIPEPFNNHAVSSRLLVMSTQSKVLQQNLKRSDLTPEMVNKDGRAIYEAFQSLNIQLNEVFLRQVSDLEFDIDSQQDSIQKSKSIK